MVGCVKGLDGMDMLFVYSCMASKIFLLRVLEPEVKRKKERKECGIKMGHEDFIYDFDLCVLRSVTEFSWSKYSYWDYQAGLCPC